MTLIHDQEENEMNIEFKYSKKAFLYFLDS
jgi:hypothetical protein